MKICEICEKKKMTGYRVSYSHRKTKRKFLPNIFKKKFLINGEYKKINICAKCLKKMGKPRDCS